MTLLDSGLDDTSSQETAVSQNVHATLHFLKRKLLYGTEKLYTLRYLPDGDADQTNIELERMNEISFDIMNMECAMRYEDFGDPAKIELLYLKQLKESVKSHLSAESVFAVPHAVGPGVRSDNTSVSVPAIQLVLYKIRRRHPESPFSTGRHYEFEQPTNVAHTGKDHWPHIRTSANVLFFGPAISSYN